MYIYCMYRTEGVGALGQQLPTQLPAVHLPAVQQLPHLPREIHTLPSLPSLPGNHPNEEQPHLAPIGSQLPVSQGYTGRIPHDDNKQHLVDKGDRVANDDLKIHIKVSPPVSIENNTHEDEEDDFWMD